MPRVLAILVIFAALLFSGRAHAKPEYLEVLTETFKSNTALAEKSCANCHVSDSDYSKNPYGTLVGRALLDANTKQLTSAMLTKIGEPGSAAAASASAAAPPPHKPKSLVPKN